MTINSTVSQHAIIQFTAEVNTIMQQKKSRLKEHVRIRDMKGKAMAYDGIGRIELAETNARYGAVEFGEMDHFRRKITKKKFVRALPIDKTDVEERLVNPESGYAEALADAANRQFDRLVAEAMFADVATGEDFENTVTFAGEGGLTVDATAGLTYEKLLEIQQNFIDNEVGNEGDLSIVMGISGDENTDLMSEMELTSGDYSREYVVDKGTIQMAMGIKLIKFGANEPQPILTESGGVRTSFCMTNNAMMVGLSRNWEIKVQERNDLVDTTQVIITGVLGAVRTEAKRIQKVTFTV